MGFVDRDPKPKPRAREPVRHVWVRQSREYGSLKPWAGLLIEWRKDESGSWLALVAVVSGGVGNHMGVCWVAGDLLIPSDGREPVDPTPR
ncbi:hypothetical protein [Aeromicrobium sp.]|uniref:hypothetical protein n=1 Tax=Aeromicrobium sp. TaxID=1871063 RepID=UPI00199BB7B0|nr:hypothetical protein [Aeromicrobium sp.]MBC7631579.1 hypothetical protein [Aeromicrobium sp.]